MTKLIPLTLLCALLLCSVLKAQSPVGSFTITTGIGLTPTYIGKTAKTDIPALSFQAGYRISQNFSMHGFLGYSASSSTPKAFSDGIVSKVSNKTTTVGLKAQLHKDFTDKLEMYGGVLLGYAIFNTSETDLTTGEKIVREENTPSPYNPNAPNGEILYSGYVGSKFWFNPKISVFGELGFGISILNAGFSFRL